LVEVGNNYFMNPVAGGTGPELKYNGAAVTTGEFGPWTLIAAEATSTGYEVAWKDAPDNVYMVWDTDSNGNYVSAPIGEVSPTSAALESLEPSFHQDLNGDGVIGVPPTTLPMASANVQSSNSLPDNFQFTNGSGPTIQNSGVGTPAQSSAVTVSGSDVFVFAPNFGQVSISNFAPANDTIDFSKTVFANIQSVLAATHDDAFGNAVITDAAHDTITLKQVTTAQLLAHQNDVHFI
jgi:hypothetical protein